MVNAAYAPIVAEPSNPAQVYGNRSIPKSTIAPHPERATAEKGQEAFRRYAEHVAKAVQALAAVNVTIKNRELIDRV